MALAANTAGATVTNVATVSPTDSTPADNTSSVPVTIGAAPAPALSVVKSALPAQVATVGQTVTYSFVVTNTGNVAVTNVAVSDAQTAPAGALTTGPTCPTAALAVGGTETCTATYVVTQADLNNGKVTDTATATGTPPTGPPVTSPPSTVVVPATQTPTISLVKTASVASFSAPGTVITYSYKVTDTGNVDLNPVVVTDPMAGLSAIACPATVLAAGGTETCTATYTTTQADVTSGSVNNTGTATGTPPTGPPVKATSAVSVPAAQGPALSVVKSALPAQVATVGQTVTYSFVVTNTGNVAVTNVAVSDAQTAPAGALTTGPTCPTAALAVGGTETCTATYVVTQADLNNGKVTDTATATGTPPTGPPVTSPPSTVVVSAPGDPALKVVKTATPTQVSTVGQTITYSFVVTNTGNIPVTTVSITDTQTAPSGPLTTGPTCPSTSLAPAASETCSATYVVTQADLDGGTISDSAVVTGIPPTGPPIISPPSTVTVTVSKTPPTTPSSPSTPSNEMTTSSFTPSSGYTSSSPASGVGTTGTSGPLAFTGAPVVQQIEVALLTFLLGLSLLWGAGRYRRGKKV